MQRLAVSVMGTALALSLASIAGAAYRYPPGPSYRSCGDTLKIFDIQQADTLLAPCHPATLDTVYGVRGIITAFDPKASGFGFYVQNTFANGPHAYTGVFAYTGSANYNASLPGTPTGGNLALGDSVVVYGTTQEFPVSNGETEIDGPDLVPSTNDIIIRKINGGNALPAAKVGTTHDFNWVPSNPGNQGELWEGCLVRINGPLKVARVQPGAGVNSGYFLVIKSTSPSDSVLIDGLTLTTYATPPQGATIEFVQGILTQHNSTVGVGNVNSYRIQLRGTADIGVDVPPGLTDAYPIEDNQLRLIFDRNIDPVAGQMAGNYHLASELGGSTVNTAVLALPDSDKVVLTITSVLGDGDFETVSFENLGSQLCPLCTGIGQSDFFNGVQTIANVQAPDPAFLPLFDDRSRFAGAGTAPGPRLSLRGVGVQQFGSLHYIEDAAGGYRSGISVFGPSQALLPNEKYLIAGVVREFGGETELEGTVYIKDEGAALAPPSAAVQTVGVLEDTTTDMSGGVPGSRITGEDYEGVLVQVNNVFVCPFANPPRDPAAGGSFLVTDTSPARRDTILVSSVVGNLTFDADTGQVVNVTGVLHFSNGSFRICPRFDSDIQHVTAGVGGPAAKQISLRVEPNPGVAQSVSFVVPRRDQVELAVFDVEGRRLATLASGPMPAGSYTQKWDGRDASGRSMSAGMFFYRLKVGGEQRVTRAVTLR